MNVSITIFSLCHRNVALVSASTETATCFRISRTPRVFRISSVLMLKPRLTVLGAGQLCQDAEGAGLRVASPGVPVLCVLDQPLLAGVKQLSVRVQVQLPVEASRTPEWREAAAAGQDFLTSFFYYYYYWRAGEQMVKTFKVVRARKATPTTVSNNPDGWHATL